MSLTQIQLEEAMKPARYEAPVSQQLPLEARGSMVLDPGTTVASLAGKDKLSASATGPIGSLLAGDKIQFGRFSTIFCSLVCNLIYQNFEVLASISACENTISGLLVIKDHSFCGTLLMFILHFIVSNDEVGHEFNPARCTLLLETLFSVFAT